MQKLLIVLAIQFCLPLAAYGLQCSWQTAWLWSLDSITVIINTICASSMIGLLRPRWKLMLLGTGLLICYLALWQGVYFSRWRDYWVNPGLLDRWLYLKFLLFLAMVSFGLSSLLSYFFKLEINSKRSAPPSWRFSLGDLLFLTTLVALVVMTASVRFEVTDTFENFLWFFAHVDVVFMIAALLIVYPLLWQTWSWKLVSLAISAAGIFLLALWPVPDYAHKFGLSAQDYHVARFGFLYLAIVTVVLYRAAGLRIAWRCPERAPISPPDAGGQSSD